MVLGIAPAPALAQASAGSAATVSQPVVQPVPAQSPGMKLNDALNELARNPQNVEALIAAGRASLELGDVDAAVGFFQRADTLWPGSARVKTGLAGAYVLANDPTTAIELFNQAEKLGPLDAQALSDRGLAYDMVGDPQTAQADYRRSLDLAPADETYRRLALSQAISGDRRGMENTLGPLIQRGDKAAWRTRAFALAILGDATSAETIVRQSLPADIATPLVGYLGYMPRLTRAQQAAAANLGVFPRSAEIGRDDPRFAQFVRPRTAVAAATPVPPKPADKGKDKGKGKARDKDKAPAVAMAGPPIAPTVPTVGREVDGKPVQLAAAPPPPPPPPPPSPRPAPVPPPPPPPAPKPAAVPTPSGPGLAAIAPSPTARPGGFDLRQVGSGNPSNPGPTPTPAPPPAPPPSPPPAPPPPPPRAAPKPSMDQAFAGFDAPSREVEPRAGAVDVRHVRPLADPAGDPGKDKDLAKDQPKGKDQAKGKGKGKDKTAKPEQPSHPSRIWVQVATGRDKAALAFDWRRMSREAPEVFKGQRPSVTAWGQTNRLLTGPFASQKEANAFMANLKKAGISGSFVWTSPAGQVVDALPGK